VRILLTNAQREPPPHPWNEPDAPQSTPARTPTETPNHEDTVHFSVPLHYAKEANAPRPAMSETPPTEDSARNAKGTKSPARRVGATSLGTQRSMRTPPLNTEESNPSTTQSRSQNGTTPRRTGFTPPVRDAPQRRRPGTGGGETVTQSSRLPPQPANRWTKSPHQTAYSSQGRATTAGGRPQRGTKPRKESGT